MKRKSAVLAAVATLAVVLTACSTATPYQPNIRGNAVSGGYSEVRVEPNRFRVTFAGNSLTSRETVEGSLLYRAAELTLAQGYDWFAIVDRRTDQKTRTYIEPTFGPGYGYGYGYGAWAPYWRYHGAGYGWRTWDPYWGGPFWGDSYDVRTIDRFEATAEIQMNRGPKPATDPAAFDARSVVENLGPMMVRPVQKG